MTVGDMLQRMSSAELTEWMAFYVVEPFGEEHADFRAGVIASVTANHSMSPPDKPRRPSDFFGSRTDGLTRAPDGSILLADPVEQAKLIKRMVFGVKDA
jgi:hypothetical protein